MSVSPSPSASISVSSPPPSQQIQILNANLQPPYRVRVGLKMFVWLGLFSKHYFPQGKIIRWLLNIHQQKDFSRSGFIQQRAKPPAGSPGSPGAPAKASPPSKTKLNIPRPQGWHMENTVWKTVPFHSWVPADGVGQHSW